MKQATLFPQAPEIVLSELDLKEAEKMACQVREAVAGDCKIIEVAGSISATQRKGT